MIQNLRSIDSLKFFPDSRDTLEVCQMLLEANPGIQNLYLASDFGILDEDLHDKSTEPGLFSLTLFNHLYPFDTCTTPLILKQLCIDKMNLNWAGDTYLKLMMFHCLETLEIVNCNGADNFFQAISRLSLRPPRLKTLRWIQDETTDSHSCAVFEGFLEVAPMLQTLHFDVHRLRSLPKVAALTRHGQTLTSLSIHGHTLSSHIHHYSTKQFEDICVGCPNLRQLAIAFPTTNVDCTEPASEFDSCLVRPPTLKTLRSTCTDPRCSAAQENFVDLRVSISGIGPSCGNCILEDPTVVSTARITTVTSTVCLLPKYQYFLELTVLNNTELQRIAQRAFEASDYLASHSQYGYGLGNRSYLSVIAFGGNGKSNVEFLQGEIKLKQVVFVRGTKIDAFGNSGISAVKTEWRMVQFVEPESEILNQSLYSLHNVHSGPS